MSDMWNVRGVSVEARKAAKLAAVEAGITLGKWLEQAIKNQAGSDGRVKRGLKKIADHADRIEPMKMPEVPVEVLATVDAGDAVDALIESAHEEPPKGRAPVKKTCPHGNSTGHFCLHCNRTVD